MSAAALVWNQRKDPNATHAVADEAERYYTVAPQLTLAQVADAFLVGYAVPDDDDGTPVRFSVEDLRTGESEVFRGLPDQSATPAPRRGRPPAAPHLARVMVAIRLPQWLVTWIEAQGGDKTALIEEALIKRHKLKAPKS